VKSFTFVDNFSGTGLSHLVHLGPGDHTAPDGRNFRKKLGAPRFAARKNPVHTDPTLPPLVLALRVPFGTTCMAGSAFISGHTTRW